MIMNHEVETWTLISIVGTLTPSQPLLLSILAGRDWRGAFSGLSLSGPSFWKGGMGHRIVHLRWAIKFANAVKLSKTRILETVSETVPHVFNEVLKKRYNIIIYHAFVYNVIDLFVLMDGSHSIGMTWYLMRGPKYWFMLFSFFKTWWAMTAVWNKLLQTLLHCKTWGKRIENFQWFPASRTQALGECPRIRTFRGPKIGEHPAAGSLHPGQRHTNIQTVLEQTRRYTMQSTHTVHVSYMYIPNNHLMITMYSYGRLLNIHLLNEKEPCVSSQWCSKF